MLCKALNVSRNDDDFNNQDADVMMPENPYCNGNFVSCVKEGAIVGSGSRLNPPDCEN